MASGFFYSLVIVHSRVSLFHDTEVRLNRNTRPHSSDASKRLIRHRESPSPLFFSPFSGLSEDDKKRSGSNEDGRKWSSRVFEEWILPFPFLSFAHSLYISLVHSPQWHGPGRYYIDSFSIPISAWPREQRNSIVEKNINPLYSQWLLSVEWRTDAHVPEFRKSTAIFAVFAMAKNRN